MPFHPLLQAAAQAVAVTPSSGALSTGEWAAIITLGLTMMGACFQFGRVLANGSHLRETVETKLATMDAKLDKITQQGDAAQRERVVDAGVLANHEVRIASLEREHERRVGPPDRRD